MLLEDGNSYIEMKDGTVRFHFEVDRRGLLINGAWSWPGHNWRSVALGAAIRHMDVLENGAWVNTREIINEIGESNLGSVLSWLDKNGICLEKCESNHDVTFCDVELA